MKNPLQITHIKQLRKSSVYLADGRLARFTGEFRRCGLPRPAREDGKLVFKRPLHAKFSAHGDNFMVRAAKIQKVDGDGVRAYLGRRPSEAIGGENKTGECERVQIALAALGK